MNSRHLVSGALLAGIGAMYACGDSLPLAPKPAAMSADRVAAGLGGSQSEHVRVLRWNKPLGADVVGSAIIGSRGGSIRMPDLGVVFSVPAGALKGQTMITMRVLAGHSVVVQMDPQGLAFAKAATLTVSLRNTNAYGKTALRQILLGGYIQSPLLIGADDGVDSYEVMPARVDPAVTVAAFPVRHFSVVILASQITCCSITAGGGGKN